MDHPTIAHRNFVAPACWQFLYILIGTMVFTSPVRGELVAEVKSVRGSPTIFVNGVAAAAKWTRAGLRVYIGALQCPAKLLRNILRASGVHLYTDSDDVVLTDGKFLGIVATSPGPKHLMFRAPCMVVRALDGRGVARDVSSLDLVMELGETKLYLLKKTDR